MPAEALLDTNILLYAISKIHTEASKAKVANELIGSVDFGLSVQVCQEFFVAATRKIAQPIPAAEAVNYLRLFTQRPLVTLTAELMFQAVDLHQRYGISYWDAAVVAAAHELSAATVYSEDLNHGQRYGKITVINPFLTVR